MNNGFGFPRWLKFFAFIGIVIMFLTSYKMLSFDNGFAVPLNEPSEYIGNLSLFTNTKEVYYYDLFDDENAYMVVAETHSNGSFSFILAKNELPAFLVTFVLFTPEKIYPTHWGWFLGGIVLLLFLPTKRY